MPAHWWMKLGFVPLVGKAVSSSVFRGGRGLKMTLGNLFANG